MDGYSIEFKGTKDVILSVPPPLIGLHIRFTTIPFKPLSDHKQMRFPNFLNENLLFLLWFLCRSDLCILAGRRNNEGNRWNSTLFRKGIVL